MSRSKRFIRNLFSSYASIAINIIYTIASIPLALHYLTKEEFGIWALVTQLAGYLMLLEMGMVGSVARSLSDHKDNIQDGVYGSILRTGSRVFALQGGLVFILGMIMAFYAPSLLNLPIHLHHSFAVIMSVQALLNGTKLAAGALASPLWCHQRLDISNGISSISLIITFSGLWIGFHLGWHLYSLSIATTAGFIMGLLLTYAACRRQGFYPPKAYHGRFEKKIFRELFHFGGGLFLMNLGGQLASASQVIVVSRLLGIEAATTWSVATKVLSMAQLFVSRIFDSSSGVLAEMVVRDETQTLYRRFSQVISVSAVLAVTASAGIALTNGAFIEVWTSGRVSWNPWNNLLLGCILFSSAVTRCHTCLVGITKDIRGMKYINLAEGICFILLSVSLANTFGITGILLATLFCNIFITGFYGIKRTSEYFSISKAEVTRWISHPMKIFSIILILFLATTFSSFASFAPVKRFALSITFFSLIILPSIWFFGINQPLRAELLRVILSAKYKISSAVKNRLA